MRCARRGRSTATSTCCSTAPAGCTRASSRTRRVEDWQRSFEINVTSMFVLCQAFLPHFVKRGARQHHQHRVGRVEPQGRAQPHRLHEQQGGGDRAHQVDRVRLHEGRHPGELDVPGQRGLALAARAGAARPATTTRRGRPSSRASRWAGWRSRTRWRTSRSISRATRAPMRRGRTSWSMAGSRCRASPHPPRPTSRVREREDRTLDDLSRTGRWRERRVRAASLLRHVPPGLCRLGLVPPPDRREARREFGQRVGVAEAVPAGDARRCGGSSSGR